MHKSAKVISRIFQMSWTFWHFSFFKKAQSVKVFTSQIKYARKDNWWRETGPPQCERWSSIQLRPRRETIGLSFGGWFKWLFFIFQTKHIISVLLSWLFRGDDKNRLYLYLLCDFITTPVVVWPLIHIYTLLSDNFTQKLCCSHTDTTLCLHQTPIARVLFLFCLRLCVYWCSLTSTHTHTRPHTRTMITEVTCLEVMSHNKIVSVG